MQNSFQNVLAKMREDWDRRADEDAEGAVYSQPKCEFNESGRLNFVQIVQPDLPILLDDRPASQCRMLEIGCGLGRMTRTFAEHFLEVHGVDVSEKMVQQARERLSDCSNVVLHVGSGCDLAGLPDDYFDFVFSFIVFQHVPSKEVIASYAHDVRRVLRPGGTFKFQLQGYQDPEYLRAPKDTWLGETFSFAEAVDLIEGAKLQPVAADGAGTQYFLLTARKARESSEDMATLKRDLLDRGVWASCVEAEIRRLEMVIGEQQRQQVPATTPDMPATGG